MTNLHIFPDNPSFVEGSADFIADVAAGVIGERRAALAGGCGGRSKSEGPISVKEST